ncbi:MAG TPA: AsmA family protein [Acidisarcina sp.]
MAVPHDQGAPALSASEAGTARRPSHPSTSASRAVVEYSRHARWWLPLLILLLLMAALLLPPLVNINRYHRRIAESISAALGRPVRLSGVKLVMLPRPGFELSDFMVEEDPDFGVEPILSSSSVVASVRLSSLWRGRLEIGRIHLEEPSLNLVRNGPGRWNFSAVLLQAARTPNAPTGQRHPGGTLRFPYIDANNARINFKRGSEKLPFSFMNADLSVWLADPGEWQLRFEAQPVRTDLDLNLGDTGLVRVQGALRRARSLNEMPIDLAVEWSGASLGQLSRLVAGSDPGWRGVMDLRGTITGKTGDALVRTRLSGERIHRVEFESDNTLNFAANCEMHYRHGMQAVEGLSCSTPLGDGQLLLTGAVHDIATAPAAVLGLSVEKVPVDAILRGAEMMRRGFPPGVRAAGQLNGQFSFDSTRAQRFMGEASVQRLTISSDGLKRPLVLAGVTVSAQPASELTVQVVSRRRHSAKTQRAGGAVARAKQPLRSSFSGAAGHSQTFLAVSPLQLGAASATPLTLTAQLGVDEFQLHLAGAAPISRLAALDQSFPMLPLPASSLGPEGSANLDLTISGPWLPPASVGTEIIVSPSAANSRRIEGTISLGNTQLTTGFLASPVEIVSAQGVFSGNRVSWEPLSINFGALHADGSLDLPVPCPSSEQCSRRFDLHITSLDIAELQSTLLGARRGQLVEEILSTIERPHPWPALEGTLHVDTLTLNRRAASTLVLHGVTAAFRASGNTLELQSLSAQALGGTLSASGRIDASGVLPAYSVKLALKGCDALQAAAVFGERWGSGALEIDSQAQFRGFTLPQITASTTGDFHMEWTGHTASAAPQETMAHGGATLLGGFDSWVADGTIANQRLDFLHSVITPVIANDRALSRGPGAVARSGSQGDPVHLQVAVTGSISFSRELSLRAEPISALSRDVPAIDDHTLSPETDTTGISVATEIGGTLQRPTVLPSKTTPARPVPRVRR